ncbi:hypothetical protein GCM10010497_46090 [Streptomyces cinereoruber]|uniref:DUF3168 domain-containing protein n=1 Tax=Streptomyces cinereoruber TaxID=67260 RepID=A0AAV4KNE2_9ACTN|nr:DUF3168 domain-containing protein [Streptomyces cinereoruber]MBB4160078.1 hypothetical protein [Streptomyces cinereoruber]MBY8818311.1 DUF3168 domain-containing protein [Streptomyces cinereoruber]NIH61016.1 hypothetical protein [Streptomyces cinereoruber]QEV33271.1 DUF3168 domain-containing protein [Streptomyces cinereoruber]GGR37979.1 hypothetical protein GCM10010497_46090 [Streptomyces cinereoruber]
MTTPPVPAPPSWPIQKAVYARLTGDPQLADLLAGGVHDYTPEDTPYPFVVVGEAIDTPDNRHGGYGWQTVLTLHTWTRAEGNGQAFAIGARLTALLDHQPLTLPGYDHLVTRYEYGQILTDPEPPGDIRHLVLRYRIVTEQPT